MTKMNSLIKCTSCIIIALALVFTGAGLTKSKEGILPSLEILNKASAASDTAYAYYVSNSVLYRVKNDGTGNQKLLNNFYGVNLKVAGNYLYYMYDEKSSTFLSLPLDGSAAMPTRFIDARIVYYDTDGTNIYYMNDEGEIYRSPANANAKEAKLVADMADTNYPSFSIINGKIYYNALKNGRTSWVASKAADGSGQVQWIASGAFPDSWYVHKDNTNVYMMVNSKPEEKYSTNSMLLYSIPQKSGAAKALNSKAPLDVNAVYSGMWTNNYFVYNKDVKYGSGEWDYSKAKGYAIDLKGKSIQLHTRGIIEIADCGTNKLAFVDSDYKGFVGTISAGKVSKKDLNIKNAGYARDLKSGSEIGPTAFFAQGGGYILQPDLSLKKVVGEEWQECMYDDAVDGLFYINAGDNLRLYYLGADGSTNIKLSDEKKVTGIVLISKY